MDIRKFAVEDTSVLHLRGADDELLYDTKDGAPDLTKPLTITLYGPGSRPHVKASAAKSNKMIDRIKKKGKSDVSADDNIAENAAFLAACTKDMQNIDIDGLQGEALFKAVYSNTGIGFVAEQAGKHLAEWGNFKPASATK